MNKPPELPPDVGLLLAAHGTRNQQGRAECRMLADQLAAAMPQTPLELAYLELAEPTIAQGIERLARRGIGRMLVAPLLLFAAGHAKRDIPREVATAAAEHGLKFVMADHFGCHESLLELSAVRFREALAGRPPCDAAETALVLAGRGSRDDSATAEMNRFTRLRGRITPVGRAMTAFLAMAEPRLEAVLANLAEEAATPTTGAAAAQIRRVVVQPHLLFTGDLLAGCQRLVERYAEQSPQLEWIVAGHLEPHPLLLDALCSRLAQGAGAFSDTRPRASRVR